MYGPYNTQRNIPSNEELKNLDPQKLIDMLKDLKNYKHTVLYYGPMEVKDMTKVVDKYHALPKKFSADPESRPYKMELTSANEVVIAPYKAKNIYMYQYHNEGKKWTPEHEAMINMFNGYFGGGMNTVVFQELRESRGLAYSAWASYMTPFRPADSEFFLTSIISQNDKMNDCIATFNSIMNNVPQSEKAFEIAKQAEMKRIEASRTTKLNIIYSYLNAKKLGYDYSLQQKVYNVLPKITLQDLVKFVNENIANKPFRYIILGDESDIDMKSLEKIGPVKKLSTEEIFGY